MQLDPLSSSSLPLDTDDDSVCDELDDDDDGDGYLDSDDDFPTDDSEWIDTDNDGIGNNRILMAMASLILTNCYVGSNPLSYASVPVDTDSDGICDIMDSDDDGDGFLDSDDDFPTNPTEWVDTDSDGQEITRTSMMIMTVLLTNTTHSTQIQTSSMTSMGMA